LLTQAPPGLPPVLSLLLASSALPGTSGIRARPFSVERPPMTDSPTILRRYTDITSVIYMLRNKKLTLLDPTLWDDQNDSHYIQLYRETKKLGAVLALCFTEASETYHHWRVFSGSRQGICIRFNKPLLLDHLSKYKSIRTNFALYRTLENLREHPPEISDLPFLKRYAFRDEKEFRIIYELKNRTQKKDIILPLECIDRITINPWLSRSLSVALWDTIREIDGCSNLHLGQSTLINNKEWKKLGQPLT